MVRNLAHRRRHTAFILKDGDELQDFVLAWSQ
jgi:hypothetical protein